VTAQIALLPPLLRAVDGELAERLAAAEQADGRGGGGRDFEAHWALPWALSWHAHSCRDAATVQRLFDFFLAAPLAAPLYLGAAAAVLCRAQLLAGPPDAAEAHHLLAALPPLSR
jgi:hypothetical protein